MLAKQLRPAMLEFLPRLLPQQFLRQIHKPAGRELSKSEMAAAKGLSMCLFASEMKIVGMQAQPHNMGGRRRSSVVDVVTAKTTQAVRRASLAM